MPPRRPTLHPTVGASTRRPSGAGTATGAPRASASRPGARPAGQRPAPRPGNRPSIPAGHTQAAAVAAPTVAAVRRRIALVRPVTALAGTGVVLVLLLAPYAKQWLDQRGQLADMRAEVARSEQTVAQLQEQRRRWEDPAFVAAQARSRLNFARPGETNYVVVDDRPKAAEPAENLPDTVRKVARPEQPWFSDLWSSVVAAGAPSPQPTPAPSITVPALSPTPSAPSASASGAASASPRP